MNQRHWRDYFNTGIVGSDAPEYIKKASWTIEYANLSEEEKAMVFALEKAQAIYDTEIVSSFLDGRDEGIVLGEAKGEAKGKAKGEAAKALAIAKNAINMNMPVDTIMMLTGLTRDEIEGLQFNI